MLLRKIIGFTLSEVLITLGVIGIVAAMTLPTLIQKHQEKVTISRLKKAYSALSQAYLFTVQEYGTPDNWNLKSLERIYNDDGEIISYDASGIEIQRKFLTKFMKGKNCETSSECAAKNNIVETNLSLTNPNSSIKMFPKYVMADGTIISFTNIVSETCSAADVGKTKVCSHLEVFLPSGKKELRRGVNNFMFYITTEGIIPAGRDGTAQFTFERDCVNDSSNTRSTNGHGCTAWVIMHENMDYLHCNDLSWNGKIKCK